MIPFSVRLHVFLIWKTELLVALNTVNAISLFWVHMVELRKAVAQRKVVLGAKVGGRQGLGVLHFGMFARCCYTWCICTQSKFVLFSNHLDQLPQWGLLSWYMNKRRQKMRKEFYFLTLKPPYYDILGWQKESVIISNQYIILDMTFRLFKILLL